jgi:hypothetical protein
MRLLIDSRKVIERSPKVYVSKPCVRTIADQHVLCLKYLKCNCGRLLMAERSQPSAHVSDRLNDGS